VQFANFHSMDRETLTRPGNMAKSDRRPKSRAARPVMAMPPWLLARVSIGNVQAYRHGQGREVQALRSHLPGE
jgi:hypothetical protein